MATNKTKRKVRNDLIFIAALLAVVTVAGACLFFLRGEGTTVTIKVNAKTVGVYSLSEDRVVEIPSDRGHNRLIIRDGTAYMETATCPNGICVAHHPIHRQGESIVCLPNQVVVEISGDQTEAPDVVL
ncbi:MAG: NusG domain II-containing protein [Ruminococcaceae bacterium]|nr:NusG domain II-containing protein [Oscillospiraceae bacterium]